MKQFQRGILEQIQAKIGQQKVLIIYGSRRTGKTYLMQQLFEVQTSKKLWINGEDVEIQKKLSNRSVANYQLLFSGIKLLCIDEAQNIEEIGQVLKLIIDHIEGLTIIVTGSSSFDISNAAGAPLLGRSYTYHLMPISIIEQSNVDSNFEIMNQLDTRLIYGSYPEIFKFENEIDKQEYLVDLGIGNLLRDVFKFEGIQNSSKVQQLLELVAHQMGSEVSYNELGKSLGISKNTVERYLDLLEKNFILFSLRGYSNNDRSEVTKTHKWYFYDNGIRNAIIRKFGARNSREDWGALFEAFVIQERIKLNQHKRQFTQFYFWRTYAQQEVDLIEKRDDKIYAFECKVKQKSKITKAFATKYPEAEVGIVTEANFLAYLL